MLPSGFGPEEEMERMDLVVRLVFKTSSGRITPPVAGSIPALSATPKRGGQQGLSELIKILLPSTFQGHHNGFHDHSYGNFGGTGAFLSGFWVRALSAVRRTFLCAGRDFPRRQPISCGCRE